MRQRKAKDLDKRLQECSGYIKTVPEGGEWQRLFDKTAHGETRKEDSESDHLIQPELYLEIGCGKGQFIIRKAADNPDKRYVAIEGQETVILRAAEKARAVSGEIPWPENVGGEEQLQVIKARLCGPLNNLIFVSCFVDKMSDLFRENQLSGVYLNFSDPWPKARHAKRRLTYRERLLDYAWAIKPGGFIEIKTDNEGLFEFTLEEIEACEGKGISRIETTRDLHGVGSGTECADGGSGYESAQTTTEYEDKFSGRGKNINYVKVIINK